MVLSKLAEKCKACPKVDSCDHKKMEMCALAELPQRAMAEVTTTAKALIFMHRIPTREVFADRSKLCGRKRGKDA